jgi:hypothetical protein
MDNMDSINLTYNKVKRIKAILRSFSILQELQVAEGLVEINSPRPNNSTILQEQHQIYLTLLRLVVWVSEGESNAINNNKLQTKTIV